MESRPRLHPARRHPRHRRPGHRLGPGHPRRPQPPRRRRHRGPGRRGPPRPGGEHDKNTRKAIHYLQAKEPCLDYPAALARGWPIATGVIEGACRHIAGVRLGITGARWSLPGAQAMLWMRAIAASGDTAAYWDWHITREHHRNHLSKLRNPPAPQHALELAA